mmetsp:Transcript_21946/g.32862  ORF Transcript_21946/g.32862 Transcript_21946/m.32862 type:complete len:330 (+) Transcript_21946:1854-2843(+)|eukprot:CAMPEP_0203679994 /NCGR_PEP_ID=MMETSP0090-20130426/37738_1 /ASSEMBLY_ACC=CAM_ASM_001088 /TAXON_ID=426623 /ORGANISM="Chaetoceros affinis, Strain CCMP159" /LENGTH=329 /DNA_ID=CAMNT_0050547865 /DNA_START=1771 /DNA_END=2760 /DNA_ORIENTATION=+
MITTIARESNYCLVQRTKWLLLASMVWRTGAFQTVQPASTLHPKQQLHRPMFISKSTLSMPYRGRKISPQMPQFMPSQTSTSLRAFELMTPSLAKIDNFYQTAPYTAAFVTCGIKASAADLLAQTRSLNQNTQEGDTQGEDGGQNNIIEEKTNRGTSTSSGLLAKVSSQQESELSSDSANSLEVQRNLAFILYGGLYQGMAQQYIYNSLFPAWFGTGNDMMTVLTKVSFDLLVLSPLVCIPIAYFVKALIYGQNLSQGLEKYIYDLRYNNLLLTYYSIWFPAGCLSFGVIPDHLRIAFIAFVSFFWLIILSTVSSSSTQDGSTDKVERT